MSDTTARSPVALAAAPGRLPSASSIIYNRDVATERSGRGVAVYVLRPRALGEAPRLAAGARAGHRAVTVGVGLRECFIIPLSGRASRRSGSVVSERLADSAAEDLQLCRVKAEQQSAGFWQSWDGHMGAHSKKSGKQSAGRRMG